MNQISITKEFTWDMAHMLSDYSGLCSNLHGHTYKMHVEVCRNDNLITNSLHLDGMVLDFSQIKRIVHDKIIDSIDHAFMYWDKSNDEVEQDIAKLLISKGKKVYSVSYRTTVEQMANHFFEILSKEFLNYNIIVKKIKIWETPTSFAEVRGD